MDCSLPFLKLTRRIRVPFLSRFLLLLFVYNCSLFLLRFVLFVFSLSLLPHVSTLSFCFETKLSPVFRTNLTWRRSEVALVFGDVRGYLETLFQASTLQLREDWATPRAGGSLRRKCAWAGYLHFTETGNRENELLGVLKMIIRLN